MKKSVNAIILSTFSIVLTCGVLFSLDRSPKTADPSEIFLKANQAYKETEYAKAITLYKELLAMGTVNGDIYYNLGNAYLKTGKIGKALLNYRKAEILLPRDEDLQANIQYTLELTKDKIEGREFLSFLKSFCFWYSKLNNRELFIFFLIINFFCWGIATVRLFYKREYLSFLMYIFVFLGVLTGISSGIKIFYYYFNHNGVVVAREVNVRSGKSLNDTVLFQLHEGSEFKWEEESDGWVMIRLKDGKRGWTQRQTVEKIVIAAAK